MGGRTGQEDLSPHSCDPALHSPTQMPRLTANARRGVRRCRARSGNTVTYQRSTLMAVRVAQVACTDTWEGRELGVCPTPCPV